MADSAVSVSILTPMHNRRATFLPLSIASVRSLRLLGTWEQISADDGSDDDTSEYPADLAARDSAARAARGEYLVDLDDDDLLAVDGVAQRVDYLDVHPEFWAAHGNAAKIDEDGRHLIGEDVRNFLCADREHNQRFLKARWAHLVAAAGDPPRPRAGIARPGRNRSRLNV